MSTLPGGVFGVFGVARTAVVDSGGGHGYINGGSAAGGQLWAGAGAAEAAATVAAAGGADVGMLAVTAAGVGHCAASVAVPAARQRTKKLPSLPLNTGFSS